MPKMAEKNSLNRILNMKLGQISQLHNKLKEVVDSYVSKITGSARMWIDGSEDYNQHSFTEVTIQLDHAMFILMEKASEIESNLASQSLNADTVDTASRSATHSSCQIQVPSQSIDQSSCSLQDRVHALEKVVGIVQSGLDGCRKQIGSIEGIKANLENLASQVEVMTNDKRLQQIQREIENYKSQQVTSMRNFEDKLLRIEKSLNFTDCRELSVFLREGHRTLCDSSSRFDDRLCDLEMKYERVIMMENKLAEQESRNTALKLQTNRVVRDRRWESNDMAVVLEMLSDLKIEISNMTDRKLLSFEGRLQSLDKNKNVQTETRSMGFQETRPTRPVAGTVTKPSNSYGSYIARGYAALPGIPWGLFKRSSPSY